MERINWSRGSPAQHLLDGKGDLLFDLLGAERGGHAVDLDLHRRRVGKSVNVQAPHRHRPEDGKGCGPEDHQQAVSQRKVDNPVQHGLSFPVVRSLLAAGTPFTEVFLEQLRPQQRTAAGRYDFARQQPGNDLGLFLIFGSKMHGADVEHLRDTIAGGSPCPGRTRRGSIPPIGPPCSERRPFDSLHGESLFRCQRHWPEDDRRHFPKTHGL